MSTLNPRSTAHNCMPVLRRLQMQHHPLFDRYMETLFELVRKGGDYRNAPAWLELKQQLKAVESEL